MASSFRSTPSRGGRRKAVRGFPETFPFRSTPSRGGRHRLAGADAWRPEVSIHALARRATRLGLRIVAGEFVSIHALARRATARRRRAGPSRPCFDPRPRAEGDTTMSMASAGSASFRSTPSRGGRRSVSALCTPSQTFRSTPSRGGRPAKTMSRIARGMFRSTPSRGGRLLKTAKSGGMSFVSIHALARRATDCRGRPGASASRFDPRPRAEGDSRRMAARLIVTVSIHALARRATHASARA